MTKVSILIPVFNREQFISECIQSALNQTFTDLEIVVVDNASDDSTWEICQRFSEQDSRVRVYRNDRNIGPVRNWQRCIDEATGEYGKFLFSDDLIFPNFLSETLPKLSDESIGFVSTAAFIGTELENSEVCYASSQSAEMISTEKYLGRLANGYPAVPVSPGAAIFRMADIRKNLLLEVPTEVLHDFTKNGAGPDVLLFALTVKDYASILMLNQPLVFFRKHAGSFSVANDESAVTEGYRLALGWFFRKHSSLKHWASFLAKIWLSNAKLNRGFESPISTIKRYSGTGTQQEIAMVLLTSIQHVVVKLFHRKFF